MGRSNVEDTSLNNGWKLPISVISGNVRALVLNGNMGELQRLLLSQRFGLLSIGTRVSGPLSTGGDVPETLTHNLELY